MVHEQISRFFTGFRRDAHPMATMVGVVGALSAFYHDALDINNPEAPHDLGVPLIAKLPTITAMAYKYNVGQPFMYPKNDLSYTANFMRMMFAVPPRSTSRTTCWCARLTASSSCTADHEQNASTSTVRWRAPPAPIPSPASRRASPACGGPAHGGANEACLEMLEEIGDVSKVGEFIKKVKNKEKGRAPDGFRPRVYKNHDPRAKLMRETCHEVLNELGLHDDRLFKLAIALEKIALEDEYFVQPQAVPERGLLFRHRAARARHPGVDVHLHLLARRAPWAGSRSGRR
jgi:citrate synthase